MQGFIYLLHSVGIIVLEMLRQCKVNTRASVYCGSGGTHREENVDKRIILKGLSRCRVLFMHRSRYRRLTLRVHLEFIVKRKTTVKPPLLKLSVVSSFISASHRHSAARNEYMQSQAVSETLSGQAKPCGPTSSHRKGPFNPAAATPQREDRKDYTTVKGGQEEGWEGREIRETGL